MFPGLWSAGFTCRIPDYYKSNISLRSTPSLSALFKFAVLAQFCYIFIILSTEYTSVSFGQVIHIPHHGTLSSIQTGS